MTRLVANGEIMHPVLRRFESQLRGRRVGYTTHASLGINLMDAPESIALHERVARANIELTARLGARNMVLHCGMSGEDQGAELEAAFARQRESLAGLGDFAAGHGVLICVETVWSYDGRETALPGRLAMEIDRIGHPAIRATLDYAHAALQCALKGADLMREVAAIAPLSKHLHLNDCFAIDRGMGDSLPAEAQAYGSGDLHMPIGWGSLPWDRLMTEADYPNDAVLNQELHPAFWHALEGDIAELRRLSGLMRRRSGPD
jgi:sugar phosphate isomerase/epimerase